MAYQSLLRWSLATSVTKMIFKNYKKTYIFLASSSFKEEKNTCREFPLTPIGVLGPGSTHARPGKYHIETFLLWFFCLCRRYSFDASFLFSFAFECFVTFSRVVKLSVIVFWPHKVLTWFVINTLLVMKVPQKKLFFNCFLKFWNHVWCRSRCLCQC